MTYNTILCGYNYVLNSVQRRRVQAINNLKNIRKTRHIKTSTITDHLGISEQFYYKLEVGSRKLTEEYLTMLSDFYNVTTDYLIGRTKHPQGYILEGDNLPKELRDIDVEMIELIRDANNSGISKEDIREIIEYRKYQKGIKP
jgi:transcriptional regulator with XRE-family HTH domain